MTQRNPSEARVPISVCVRGETRMHTRPRVTFRAEICPFPRLQSRRYLSPAKALQRKLLGMFVRLVTLGDASKCDATTLF